MLILKSIQAYQRANFKVLNETKKIHLQKKDFTRENLIEFSILFIMIFYGGAVNNDIEKVSNITFEKLKMKKLKSILINLIKQNKSDKEIENEAIKVNPKLVNSVLENSNLKIIVNKKRFLRAN